MSNQDRVVSMFSGGTIYSRKTIQKRTGLRKKEVRFILKRAVAQGKIRTRRYSEIGCGKFKGRIYDQLQFGASFNTVFGTARLVKDTNGESQFSYYTWTADTEFTAIAKAVLTANRERRASRAATENKKASVTTALT
jgi:hypothetical protein